MTNRSYLRVLTSPSNELAAGQCFWNQEEELIEYHTIPTTAYASSIQNDAVRIDVDIEGRPIFIELDLRSAELRADQNLMSPMHLSADAHRFLDYPICFPDTEIRALPDKSLIHIKLSKLLATHSWLPSQGVIWEADHLRRLSGIWLTGIVPDLTGRKAAAWRSEHWEQYRRKSTLRHQLRRGLSMGSISQSHALAQFGTFSS